MPAQIGAAQKVFISNAGGASLETVIDETVFNGGPDRPYNQFYAAMKSWGRYELVSSPADADLVLEISWALTDTGLRLPVLGQLRLVIIDPKTRITLWNLTEYVRGALLLGNRDKNFDQAMNTIVARLKALTAPPPPSSGSHRNNHAASSRTSKTLQRSTIRRTLDNQLGTRYFPLLNFKNAGRLRGAGGTIPRTPLP